jgi:hypothetical protein
MTPMAGPMMVPVPAMEVKWWPEATLRAVGTWSTPSAMWNEGQTREGERSKIRRPSHRP